MPYPEFNVVEQAEHSQNGQLRVASAALFLLAHFLEIPAIRAPGVAVVDAFVITAQQREGEGVASDAGAEITLLV